MVHRILSLLAINAALVFAQSDAQMQKAADYPVHAQLHGFELGAEYLVHSLQTDQGTIYTADYLVIEVAIFPQRGAAPVIAAGQFTLRMYADKAGEKAGKKMVLVSQAPSMVAASLKYPDWITRPRAVATAGNDNGTIMVGAPPAVGRFPGDPTASPLPRPAPPEETGPAAQVQKAAPMTMEEIVARVALPEGPAEKPVRGLLFFPFHGKTKSIRTLELLYEGPVGSEATLSFF